MKVLTGWPVPAFLFLVFGALILTSDAPPAGVAATFFGLLLVLLLWGMFREMSVHAEISRNLSIGDGPAAARLAEVQIKKRSARRRAPFLVYRAMAHELTGTWAAIEVDLAEAKPEVLRGTGGGASWQQVANCLRIGAWCELGKLARARQLFDAEVAPRVAGRGAIGDIFATLTEGRLLFAEGDLAGAQRLLLPLTKNIRLGPAQRAVAFHYLARAARAEARAAEADKLLAAAAALAPASWFGKELHAAPTASLAPAPGAAQAAAPAAAPAPAEKPEASSHEKPEASSQEKPEERSAAEPA